MRAWEKEREKPIVGRCGHDKLTATIYAVRVREIERARERESEQASERASKRARE